MNRSRGREQDTMGILLTCGTMPLTEVLGGCGETMDALATSQSGVGGVPFATVDAVQRVLRHLSEREEQVVRLRYGIGTRLHSVDEISDQLGVMPGQITRIEMRAFRKLREVSVVGDLLERPAPRPDPFHGDNRRPTPPADPRRLPEDPEREANPWDEV